MMIIEILSHTPIWVWLLLAFLISRGVKAMSPREVSPSRVLIVPLVFFVWGLSGLIGASHDVGVKLVLFVGGLVVGVVAGRALASLMPAPRILRETGKLAMPGSPVILILICLAFATKYVGNVALAIDQDPAARFEIACAMTAIGGLFSGLFWGRTLGQFQRALQAEREPSNLAGVIGLVQMRPGANPGEIRS